MKLRLSAYVAFLTLLTSSCSNVAATNSSNTEEIPVTATGFFHVKLTPQADENAPAGRLIVDKRYQGEMLGTGVGQMLSKRTESGTAVYYAIEEFEGSVDGLTGGFTLVHQGAMSGEERSLSIAILAGSGRAELANISGTLQIEQDGDTHKYRLEYVLP